MTYLRDIIAHNLKILFIGFNPGLRSAEIGHHFAGYSNRFWKLLADSGLTPTKYRPEDDQTLLALGYGITNIVPRPTRSASELSNLEYKQGRQELIQKLIFYKPRVACYLGIEVYKKFSRIKRLNCGQQNTSVVPETIDFVISSPSGLNRIPLNNQLFYYKELKKIIDLIKA